MDLFHRKEHSPPVEPKANVIMYCTAWCPGCVRARQWLKEHRIDYEEVDISQNRAAAARVRGWADGNETTPTFNIRGRIVVDCNLERVAELLGVS